MVNIKGYAFEYFMKKILYACGFQQVLPDNKIVYKASAGLMIHGLGQPHNADVLVSPPIQIPFYFPTRLLVECKCYSAPLGIAFARNVLGLREDINGFDIVTPQILDKRKNYRRNSAAIYPFDRYFYQVALASTSGFKCTAEEYAMVHRIPLISFSQSKIFRQIRQFVSEIDDYYETLSPEEQNRLKNRFSGENEYYGDFYQANYDDFVPNFVSTVDRLANNMCFGVLENGTILFLYKDTHHDNNRNQRQNFDYDGFRIYWSEDMVSWRIEEKEHNYYFELPTMLMKEWNGMVENWEREYEAKMRTLEFKKRYFPKIIIYEFVEGKTSIKVLNISKEFLQQAAKNYQEHIER